MCLCSSSACGVREASAEVGSGGIAYSLSGCKIKIFFVCASGNR